MPYFLDFGELMNPHIFICGMTGSGKTFLMKNLMVKLNLFSEAALVILDFTGEYAEFSAMANGLPTGFAEVKDSLLQNKHSILYVSLTQINSDAEKADAASRVLEQAVSYMRHSICSGVRLFVMLDEAWKVIGNTPSFEILLREGRKYGTGLILASQLIEDVSFSMLNNVATIFVFRLQNKTVLDRLAQNYLLSQEHVNAIQNFTQGNCLVLQVCKSGEKRSFSIKKVAGIELERVFRISLGVGMLEIEETRFENAIRNLCGQNCSEIIRVLRERDTVELSDLIVLLVKGGADRRELLVGMRKLGVGDSELAEAFARAVSAIDKGTRHERDVSQDVSNV